MENRRFDIAHIRKYVKGELSDKEMYVLERASHEDEMLMDLILGIEADESAGQTFNREEIINRIHSRNQKKSGKKIRSLIPISVAASILFVFGIGYYFFSYQEEKYTENYLSESPRFPSELGPEVDSIGRSTVQQENTKEKPEEPPRIAQTNISKKRNSTQQKTEKKDIKDLPRITINGTVPGIKDDSLNPLSDNKTKRLATLNHETSHLPIIEIHTNKESAIAANARMNARKSHVTDTLENNIYGYTSDQPSISSRYAIDQDSPFRNAQVMSSTTTIRQGHDTALKKLPEDNQLDEVVVTKAPLPKRSEPIIGWTSYRNYLKKATGEYEGQNGSVTVSVDINSNGKPENIRIIETSSPTLSNHAITIVKQGPRWIPGRKNNNVKFKIEFNN